MSLRKRPLARRLAVSAFAWLMLGACGGGAAGSPSPSSSTPIKIGLDFAMTIPGGSPIAPLNKQGVDALADDLNKKGGIDGHPIQVITYDNENSQDKAAQLARKLISEDHVTMIMSDRTANGLVIAPIAEAGKTLYMNLNSAYASVVQGKKWAFESVPSDEVEANVFFNFIKTQLHIDSAVLIHDENQYGSDASATGQRVAESKGVKVLGRISYTSTAPDLTPQVTRARATNAQAVVIYGIPPAPARIAQVVQRLGWQVQLIGSQPTATLKVYELAGSAANGFVVLGVFNPVSPAGEDKVFQASFKAHYNQEPNNFAVYGWDGMLMLQAAVQSAKSADPAKIRSAMEHLKGLHGVAGVYNTTPDNHVGLDPSTMLLLKIQDGHWVVVK